MDNSAFKVLIVDDNPATRRGLKLLLSLEQDVEDVFEASEWKEAERLVSEEHPNLVLLDVRMPGVSGIEVARRLRVIEPRLRLIAMSMVAESKQAALSAGADMFVEKAELVGNIRAVLGGPPCKAKAGHSGSGPS